MFNTFYNNTRVSDLSKLALANAGLVERFV